MHSLASLDLYPSALKRPDMFIYFHLCTVIWPGRERDSQEIFLLKTSWSNKRTLLQKLWACLSFLGWNVGKEQRTLCQGAPSRMWAWWADEASCGVLLREGVLQSGVGLHDAKKPQDKWGPAGECCRFGGREGRKIWMEVDVWGVCWEASEIPM